MVEDCLAVAVIVQVAVDLKRTRILESPVRATVVAFVSTTVPLTVGEQSASAAVTVNVHVLASPSVVVLEDVEYVLHVMVQVPVLAFGILA